MLHPTIDDINLLGKKFANLTRKVYL